MNSVFRSPYTRIVITLLLFLCLRIAHRYYVSYTTSGAHIIQSQQHTVKPSDIVVQKPVDHYKVIERLVPSTESWAALQSIIRNTVVQVFTQRAGVDILQPQKAPVPSQGTGSGFFINDQGEFITNWHVVDQAHMIYVQIPGMGKVQLDAQVIGLSPDRDLALCTLTDSSIKRVKDALGEIRFLVLGDSDLVFRGDELMTVGYPLGAQAVKSTKGIVSGREQHLIQIDAAINPGNSGGPSVNLKGEVIGINSLYAPDAQSVGFIITINELKIILDDLRKVHLLRKPFLGILYNNASLELTEFLGNPAPGGLYIVQTYKNSPLQKAGVLPGDMIYSIDGHAVDIYGEMSWGDEKISLIDYVARLQLGQSVSLIIYRKGIRKEITFSFYQTEMLPIKKIYPGYDIIDYEIVGGMILQPLTHNHLPLLVAYAPGLTKYAELAYQTESLIICTYIFPDSAAARLRTITPGMIIRKINGSDVHTLQDLRTVLCAMKQNEYLRIETMDSIFSVLPLQKILADDKRLAASYMYNLTPAIKKILANATAINHLTDQKVYENKKEA